MKQFNNTIIKSFLLFLVLSAAPLTVLARDSLESLRNDLNAAIGDIPVPHYIGEDYAGGIVFYVADSGQHGLIAAKADQTTVNYGIRWDNGIYKVTGTTRDGLYAGAMNTTMIIARQIVDNPTGNFAAKLAADYSVQEDGVTPCTFASNYNHPPASEICYGDWYLPSKVELNLLYRQKDVVGGFAGEYWSSTEDGSDRAWAQDFDSGRHDWHFKSFPPNVMVRAVRAF